MSLRISFSPFIRTLNKFNRQLKQFKYTLDSLFESPCQAIEKNAVLICLNYEEDYLKYAVEHAIPEVQDLMEDRKRVGVVEFNRSSRWMNIVGELEEVCQNDLDVAEAILTLYDLNRSKLAIHHFQSLLQDVTRRRHHDAVIDELKGRLRLKLSHKPFYPKPQLQRKKVNAPEKKERKQRTIDKQLTYQLREIDRAINRRWTKVLTDDVRATLEEEDDMKVMEISQYRHYARYEADWVRARESIKALQIMQVIKTARSETRRLIRRLLLMRLTMLKESGVIASNEVDEWTAKIKDEYSIEDDEDGQGGGGRHHHDAEEEKCPRDDQSLLPLPSLSSVFSSSPSSSSASLLVDSTDAAMSHDQLNESVIRHLERSIATYQSQAKAAHANVKWLKHQFGLLTSESTASIRNHVCSICKNIISQPTLTSCGHYFDSVSSAQQM